MKVIDSIYIEENYQLFSLLEGNRVIKEKHVMEIKASIEEHGYFPIPITVNEKMEIIEGQHRFMALKELGLPIYYHIVPGLSVKECSVLNSMSKNWATIDYIEAYASRGNQNYVALLDLCQRYKSVGMNAIMNSINPNVGKNLRSFNGGVDVNITKKVKDGTFECSKEQYDAAKSILEYVHRFENKAKTIGGRKDIYYIALAFVYRSAEIDKERVIKTLNESNDICEAISVMQALDEISRIYNYRYKGQKVYLSNDYQRMLDARR